MWCLLVEYTGTAWNNHLQEIKVIQFWPEVADDVGVVPAVTHCSFLSLSQPWHLMITDSAMWDFILLTVFLVNWTPCSLTQLRAKQVMSWCVFPLWSSPADLWMKTMDVAEGPGDIFTTGKDQTTQRWVWNLSSLLSVITVLAAVNLKSSCGL